MTSSPTALARALGVSRQRANQILNPEKHAARGKLYQAIKRGKVSRPNQCGRCRKRAKRIEGHHSDYTKPLEVQWVCPPCHAVVHPHFERAIARLRWPCPDCGQEIEILATQVPRKNPAHCRRCAKNYCYRGHLKTGKTCRTCFNAKRQVVVAFRNCEDCNVALPVTQNALYVQKSAKARKYAGGLTLKRCRDCHIKYARKFLKRKTHHR